MTELPRRYARVFIAWVRREAASYMQFQDQVANEVEDLFPSPARLQVVPQVSSIGPVPLPDNPSPNCL